MKINELVKKSNLEQIEEGPLGSLGTAVGKGVGGLAKGVGAVAGGVAGIGKAFKKGFAGGKATVAGDPDPNAAAAPAGAAPTQQAAAPAAGGAAQQAAQQAAPAGGAAPAADPNAAGAQPPAAKKPGFLAGLKSGLGGKPAAGGAAPAEPAASTPLKAAQDAISKLDNPGKQNILKLLQKEVPAAEPAAAPAAAPAAEPAAPTQQAAAPAAEPAAAPAPAPTQQAAAPAPAPTQQAAAPAAEPAAPAADGKLTAAQQAAKVAELKGKRSAGKTAGTTASGFSQYTKDASSQRVVGANPDGSPKIQTIKASKINTGNNLSESLARKIEQHKRKMFETGLANGTSSIFAK
jgi:hypothetical protein